MNYFMGLIGTLREVKVGYFYPCDKSHWIDLGWRMKALRLILTVFSFIFTCGYAESSLPLSDIAAVEMESAPVDENGQLCANVPPVEVPAREVLMEVKAGYFHPTNHRFRKIYPGGGGIYGAEVSLQTWKGVYAWISGSYFSESGRSLGERDRTIITMVPLGAGLKCLFDVTRHARLYFGGGALGTYLNTQDHSPYVIKSVHKWGAGGIVKAGSLVTLGKVFFLDFFADYSFMKIDCDNTHHDKLVRHDADLSGWSLGGAIGYRFGGKCHD